MEEDVAKRINNLFKSFQKIGDDYESKIGQGLTQLDQSTIEIFKTSIPAELKKVFPESTYKIKASIGQGRITKCPWIAIMNKQETTTTQQGVYLVFLLSKDLKRIYFQLAQGVTQTDYNGLILMREKIRSTLNLQNEYLLLFNDQEIDNENYKASSVYANEWNCDDDSYCANLLVAFKRAYEEYMKTKNNDNESATVMESSGNSDQQSNGNKNKSSDGKHEDEFSIKTMIGYIAQTELIYSSMLIKRFAFSLLTKPFVILSGLAGSGKTKLAITFAKALVEDSEKQLCVVSVEADWTNREPLLGFPNALQPNKYVVPENGVLQLLIEANRNSEKPYFLILDEMNMSYVERYFADFLSAMESQEAIPLWKKDKQAIGDKDVKWDDIPEKIKLPSNLFIIGTINVDETTYMFSPKVLDRANVIEFKISVKEMADFLNDMKEVHGDEIKGRAAKMAADFVKKANIKKLAENKEAVKTLNRFFELLKNVNAEFGYRSATEIFRFICQSQANDDTDAKMEIEEILDAAVVQKLLPKLHGSRKKLDPVLKQLWRLCFETANTELPISSENVAKAKFKESADKIWRMYESAIANGFTSFAEA